MKRISSKSLACACAAAVCGLALAMSGQDAAVQHDWSARLARLDPAWPRLYFELGEDVADAGSTPQDKELARTLFGLAGILDREGLARSSALAIASLSEEPRRRRALVALAALLGSDGGAIDRDPMDSDRASRRPSITAAIAFSEAFSFYRRGQGPRAAGAVKAPEVDALLTRYGAGAPGGADRFREDCRAYKGGLRPEQTRDVRASMLAIEEAVLASAVTPIETSDHGRGWSSVLIETSSRPLVEVDAARLDEAFGVDPSRPYWRAGKWTADH